MGNSVNNNMHLSNVSNYWRKHWIGFLALGIILTLGGFISLSVVVAVTVLSVVALGVILFITGAIQIIEAIETRKWDGVALHVLSGIFYLMSGGIIMYRPGLSTGDLTIVLASLYIIIGMLRILLSLAMQFRQWKWTLVSGFISLISGIIIRNYWTHSGLWATGFLVSIDLLFYGLSVLSFAIATRRVRRQTELFEVEL